MSIIETLVTTHMADDDYSATDLNRVGAAVAYVHGRLSEVGISATVVPKVDWPMGCKPRAFQMAQYSADITAIRSALAVYTSTPAAPADMEGLTVQEANAIEQILIDADDLITKIQLAYRHSGMVCAGQGGVRL